MMRKPSYFVTPGLQCGGIGRYKNAEILEVVCNCRTIVTILINLFFNAFYKSNVRSPDGS